MVCFDEGRVGRWVSTLAVAASVLCAVIYPAAAATLTYPGAAPCATTLQACVTGAGANDTIEIAQSTLIAESIDVDKSLTFQPALGFAPRVQFFFVVVTTVSKTVTIKGMADGFGVRGFVGAGGGNLVLTVENSNFTGGSSPPIEMSTNFGAGAFGTATLVATGNVLSVIGGAFSCISAISVSAVAQTTLDATLTGNVISVSDLSQCGGIEAVVGGQGGGTALIERNSITGSNFDFGIQFRHFGANVGEPTFEFAGRIVNNLITGQNGNVGAPGGIVLVADGNNAKLRATVVNNTVANGRTGLFAGGRPDLGAAVEGLIANNIVGLNSSYDIGIDTGIGITNDHNLVSSLGGYGFTPGSGTRVGNPLFTNPAGGDYRLLADSPAIDAGRDSALDPVFVLDLAGGPRRNGPIDMGAYESTFRAPPAPVPADDPVGLALLAACIALAAMRLGVRLRT